MYEFAEGGLKRLSLLALKAYCPMLPLEEGVKVGFIYILEDDCTMNYPGECA